jgi:hypothetical protein
MALRTLTDALWTEGGKVRGNLTYDDATRDVRSVQVWNEMTSPASIHVETTTNPFRSNDYQIPAGANGLVLNVPTNRYTYRVDPDDATNLLPNFIFSYTGPTPV